MWFDIPMSYFHLMNEEQASKYLIADYFDIHACEPLFAILLY